MKKTILLSVCIFLCGAALAQQFPWQDRSLSPEARADSLIAHLTLEQKAALMMNRAQGVPELGIHDYNFWSEALHGCARAGIATVFPQAIGMASSWDEDLIRQVFDVASTEHRIKYVQYRKEGGDPHYRCLHVWTPNINIFRDPRWGRGQETYGEDPYLTYRMGRAVVEGLQGKPDENGYYKLAACLKHYAVHSGPEATRHTVDITGVSYRDLMETYLYAFENIIKTTDVQQVMCAYNAVDGKPCCASPNLLQYFLREKWGFKGIVVSDCNAVADMHKVEARGLFPNDRPHAGAHALLNGTDLECGWGAPTLALAVQAGYATEADVDKSLKRVLLSRIRVGDLDPLESVSWNNVTEDMLATPESHELAVKMACESMVLLQNDGILPLAKGTKVAVMGPNAADPVCVLGNYEGTPRHAVCALEGIKARFGADVVDDPAQADVIIYIGGINPKLEAEEGDHQDAVEGFFKGDRTTIEFPRLQRAEIKALTDSGHKVVLVNMSGSAMGLAQESGECAAIMQAWYGGEGAGTAIAKILAGDYNPSGKLPVTFYASDLDLPDFECYDMAGRTYRYFKGKPLWAFGHGLSYTTFKYLKAKVRRDKLVIKLRNTGKVAGDEIVQVYVRDLDDAEGPIKALRAFKRVSVKPGRRARVTIPLDDKMFASFDKTTGELSKVTGNYELLCGGSSEDSGLISVKVSR